MQTSQPVACQLDWPGQTPVPQFISKPVSQPVNTQNIIQSIIAQSQKVVVVVFKSILRVLGWPDGWGNQTQIFLYQ